MFVVEAYLRYFGYQLGLHQEGCDSGETPPIVLAFCRVVAVSALPVTSPVKLPTTPPVAVVTPETTSPSAVACPSVEIPVTRICAKLPPEPPPRTYSLTRVMQLYG